MAMSNASGVPAPASSSSAIKCFAKCHLEIQPALYARERVLLLVPTAKAQASVQSGWEILHLPNKSPMVSVVQCASDYFAGSNCIFKVFTAIVSLQSVHCSSLNWLNVEHLC